MEYFDLIYVLLAERLKYLSEASEMTLGPCNH